MCTILENEDAYEASVNNVVDAIMDEQGPIGDTDVEFIGDVLVGVVKRRLGDISVDGAGNIRSKAEQEQLVLNCAHTFAEEITNYVYHTLNK